MIVKEETALNVRSKEDRRKTKGKYAFNMGVLK